ncbi:MAG: ParB/RepB/Spo0J family partition protein [Planctomycetota bacterium]|nr:ParB/RepB/Spo0J family partition protein [Planctomycetota bacterium]
MEKLIIDPEFKGQIPEPTPEELAQLEQNLIEHGGARDPLVSWQGILLDGHNRLEICTRLDLPYQVIALDLADRQAAQDWIDRNQLGRRNLNPDTASLLRGRIYNRTKKAHGGARESSHHFDNLKTSAKLATQFGVGKATIERDGQFARAVEDLKKADPTIEQRVHSGKVAKQSVVAAAKVHTDDWRKDERERQALVVAGKTVVANAHGLIEAQGTATRLDLMRMATGTRFVTHSLHTICHISL